MENYFYIGTDLKFRVEIKAEGYDMASDSFRIMLKSGNTIIDVPQENIVVGDEDDYYVLVNTSLLKSGPLSMIVVAEVPDEDFPTGIRREVEKINLCIIKNV